MFCVWLYYFLSGMYVSAPFTHVCLWKLYLSSGPVSNATHFITSLLFLSWIPCFPPLFCLRSTGIFLITFHFNYIFTCRVSPPKVWANSRHGTGLTHSKGHTELFIINTQYTWWLMDYISEYVTLKYPFLLDI